MISVVFAYNDRRLADDLILASLARQRTPHEVIAIDNTTGRFASAAAALNYGASQAAGDLLLFAHQDVRIDDPDWLAAAAAWLAPLADAGVAGVAGARPIGDTGRVVLSNITDSDPPQREGHRAIAAPERVDTVDECAFFVPRPVFDRFRFDERTCDGWHLYAVELSLSGASAGLGVYVLPLPLHHRSGGATIRVLGLTTYEDAYFRTLAKVIAKHSPRHDRFATTCGTWSTRRSLFLQRYPPALVRQAMRGWVRERLGVGRLRAPGT
jgi:hypothetical protein